MSKKLLSVGIVTVLVAAVLVGVGAATASAQSLSLCQTVDALVLAGVIAPDKVAAAKAAAGCGVTTTTTGTTVTSTTFTRSLTVGSTGADVTALQNWLISQGYSIPAGATGYFGAQTKAAVAAYQLAKGITPAVGYFGPITMASITTTTTTTTTTTGTGTTGGVVCPAGVTCTPIATCPAGYTCTVTGSTGSVNTGVAGDIAAAYPKLLGTPNNEAVGEGDTAVKVLGMDVKADIGSGLNLTSLKVKFDHAGSTEVALSSTRIADYIGKVSVLLGSTVVGSADISAFAKSSTGVYEGNIALSNAVIASNTVGKLYITVDANSTVDSGDLDEMWSVIVSSMRFTDGTGAALTYTPASVTTDSATIEKYFDVEAFETANNVSLTSAATSDNPDEGIIVGNDSTSFDSTLLKFTLKAKGSDITVNKIPVLLTAVGANTGVLASDLELSWSGGTDSQSVSASATTETVTFGDTSDLGIVIAAGTSKTFTVTATMNEIDGSNFSEGDYMKGAVTVASIEAVDSVDNDIAASDLTGSASGKDQHFYTIAPEVRVTSTSIVANDNGSAAPETATAHIKLAITARGGTVYLGSAGATTAAITVAAVGTNVTAAVSDPYTVSGTYTTVGSGTAKYYVVQENDTINIDVQALLTDSSGTTLAGLDVSSVKFGTVVTNDTTRSANTINWTSLTDLAKTVTVLLTK